MLVSHIGWTVPGPWSHLDWGRYLTPKELEHIHLSGHEEKRLRKKAVRLVAKTLLLNGQKEDNPIRISDCGLDRFSVGDYQQLEILPANSSKAYLAIYQNDMAIGGQLSFTHGEKISIACLSHHPVGVDIETAIMRQSAFYQQNFTNYEREWVYSNLNQHNDEDRLFTFLWTLKESLIKSGCTRHKSAWYIPEFSITTLPPFSHFTGTADTHYTIHDGAAYFKASARYYLMEEQVFTVSTFSPQD